MYSVYIHQNIKNGKRYIGITSCAPSVRWKKGFGYSDRLPIGRAFKKYGWEGFTHEIVAKELTEDEAKKLEIELISKYQTQDNKYGYNICSGGEGVTGWHPSEETKRKISEAHKGKFGSKNPNYGHKWTDEMKQRASKYMRENISEDTRKKISEAAKKRTGDKNSFYGKHHTAETKRKISEYRKRAVDMLNKDMVLLNQFSSIKEASESLKINKVSISNCCRGKTKTAGGYCWRYSN